MPSKLNVYYDNFKFSLWFFKRINKLIKLVKPEKYYPKHFYIIPSSSPDDTCGLSVLSCIFHTPKFCLAPPKTCQKDWSWKITWWGNRYAVCMSMISSTYHSTIYIPKFLLPDNQMLSPFFLLLPWQLQILPISVPLQSNFLKTKTLLNRKIQMYIMYSSLLLLFFLISKYTENKLLCFQVWNLIQLQLLSALLRPNKINV